MSDPLGQSFARRPRALPVVLLATVLTSNCWLEDCTGANKCDPSTSDCSLSITCCTPVVPSPAALTLTCQVDPIAIEGDDVVAIDLYLGGGTSPYTYSATFGDGQTATGSRPATSGGLPTHVTLDHTYTRPQSLSAQSFTFRATATDQSGQSQSCSVTHRVDPVGLDLDCVVEPRTGTAPLFVTFDARPSGCLGSCSVSWDFGDGEGSPTRHATHTYATPGDNAFFTHPARGTLVDVVEGVERSTYCQRAVQVNPASPPTSPPGSPVAPSPPS